MRPLPLPVVTTPTGTGPALSAGETPTNALAPQGATGEKETLNVPTDVFAAPGPGVSVRVATFPAMEAVPEGSGAPDGPPVTLQPPEHCGARLAENVAGTLSTLPSVLASNIASVAVVPTGGGGGAPPLPSDTRPFALIE